MEIFNTTINLLSIHDMWILGTVFLCFLIILDDIFIDSLAIFGNLKPHKMSFKEFTRMNSLSEKRIGIMIANWHEDEVLERMVAGNINNLNYHNYQFILGVYPNDLPTVQAAKNLEARFSNVTVVINTKPGPTSKGQMLNLMVEKIAEHNLAVQNHTLPSGVPYDILLMQDAEDIIHRYALKLINLRSRLYDFIQVPVLSLEIPVTKLTAGIYIDEFIESHTKDLLVREHFDAGIPSAGVGTAISMPVVMELLKKQGSFLNENTLTEDYFLGLTCHDMHVKSHFACDYYEYKDSNGKNKVEYIATREYFPQKVKQSIKQKTRWSMGISLQGLELRRWNKSHFFETYFLWRDRKGLLNAPLFTVALFFTLYYLGTYIATGTWPALEYSPYMKILATMMWGNLIFSLFRLVHRGLLVGRIYGYKMALLVPVRWILSNYINTIATYRAMYQWSKSKINGTRPAWSKTDHIIPTGFGVDNVVQPKTRTPAAPVLNPASSMNFNQEKTTTAEL